MFSGAGYSAQLRGASLIPSVVSPGTVRAQSHWRWGRDVSPAAAGPGSSQGLRSAAAGTALFCGEPAAVPPGSQSMSAARALPRLSAWPLAVFGAGSSNTGEEHGIVLPNKRLNGAKGEESPMHKQRRGAFLPHRQPRAALAVLPWSVLHGDAQLPCFCAGYPATEGALPDCDDTCRDNALRASNGGRGLPSCTNAFPGH